MKYVVFSVGQIDYCLNLYDMLQTVIRLKELNKNYKVVRLHDFCEVKL